MCAGNPANFRRVRVDGDSAVRLLHLKPLPTTPGFRAQHCCFWGFGRSVCQPLGFCRQRSKQRVERCLISNLPGYRRPQDLAAIIMEAAAISGQRVIVQSNWSKIEASSCEQL